MKKMAQRDHLLIQCKNYHGKASVMVLENNTYSNVQEIGASSQELSSLVKAIINDDLDLLTSLLNETSGRNISDRMVSVALPKQWHQVAKNVMTTPLRTSITWRNLKAMDTILSSKCVVTQNDLCLGLQKIIRHSVGDVELNIVQNLVRHGATVESPVHFTLRFEKLLLADNATTCRALVDSVCRATPTNNLLGQLLLSTSKRSAKNHTTSEPGYTVLNEQWPQFASGSARAIMAAEFSPHQYILDVKVWLAFGRVAFQHLIHALPLLVQTMTKCPIEAIGWVLRHVGRYYPHVSAEGREKIKQVPRLMFEAGMDLPRVMHVACLSPRFMAHTGFTKFTRLQKTRLRSLQHHSRRVIRRNLATGNVYRAMETANNIPTPLKDYIIMRNVQDLPWDD